MDSSFENIIEYALVKTRETVGRYVPKRKEFKETKSGWEIIKGRNNFDDKPPEWWVVRDQFDYFRHLFNEIVGQDFEMAPAVSNQQMLMVHDDIERMVGYRPDSVFMKEYIEWYMFNHVEDVISTKGFFSLKLMRGKKFIDQFISFKESQDSCSEDRL